MSSFEVPGVPDIHTLAHTDRAIAIHPSAEGECQISICRAHELAIALPDIHPATSAKHRVGRTGTVSGDFPVWRTISGCPVIFCGCPVILSLTRLCA